LKLEPMMNNPTRADPSDLPPCDLVMKGGITSGVVYPKLLAKLALNWRFKSVGGTSAGAIAAASCAAAEHGRQTGRRPDAFEELARLPDTLGGPVRPGDNDSRLFHLFKPAPWLRGHFQVLVGALNRKSGAGIVFGALGVLLWRFWIVAVLTVLLMALLGVPALMALTDLDGRAAAWVLAKALLLTGVVWGVFAFLPGVAGWRIVLAALVTAVAMAWLLRAQVGIGPWALATAALLLWLILTTAVATLIAALRFGVSLLKGLQRNGWGLVSGHSSDEAAQPQSLTDWLVDYFDGLAGRGTQGRPLTFGDLWGLPETSPRPGRATIPSAERAIDLQVMTTAVSQNLCYALPLRENAGPFYYHPADWAALFPRRVMDWLDDVSAALDASHELVLDAQGRTLRRLPGDADLPVVVAVRMSLSFPVLLSAVPLYAIDRSMQQGEETPKASKIWFSDGGISSNMPLHFFDAPLPRRPTFAVNLKGEHPLHRIDPTKPAREQEGRVYLPDNNTQGLQVQHWSPPADDKPTGLFHFLIQIVNTMQNWRDQIQFPYPGYRDRIVQVSQLANEGGLNLNMPRENIERLADAGEHAAERLDARFRTGDGWANHREIRLRGFLALAEQLVRSPSMQDEEWDEVVRQLDTRRYDAAERAMALEALATMRHLGSVFDSRGTSLVDEAPKPLPQLRIAPRI
jgi:predicted acylesterase/phospholipase RssA